MRLLSGSFVDAVDVMVAERRRTSLVFLDTRSGGSRDVNVRVDNSDDDARCRQNQHNDELDWKQRRSTPLIACIRRHVARVNLQVV